MSRFLTGLALRLAVFAACPCLTASAEEVEHPIYRSWARHPIGTAVTLRSVTRSAEHTIVTTKTSTLVKLTDVGAEIEVRTVSDGTGTLVEAPLQTYTQRKMFPLFPGMTKDDIGKPPKSSKNGEETLEMAGRTIKTQWFDSTGETEAGKSFTRTWMSDDVPGKLVKAVTRVPSAKNTTTVELVEWVCPEPKK